jgi:hypothetical protein
MSKRTFLQPDPAIQANLTSDTPKKNIRVCGHEDRTVLFCNECHGRGYEYDAMKHTPACETGHALHEIENVA